MPGQASLGVALLVYLSWNQAEEAMAVLASSARLYALTYKVFVGREVRILWMQPLFDLKAALQLETPHVIISNLPINVSVKSLEQELTCFGGMQRIRKYATWAVVTMRSVAEAKSLVTCRQLPADGRTWRLHPGKRLEEDPPQPDLFHNVKRTLTKTSTSGFNTNQPIYELSVLQLSIADRQRLYEVIQNSPPFPAKREELVKGLNADLLNKARKLLQHSRRPVEVHSSSDFLLTPDNKLVEPAPVKKPRITEPPPYVSNRPLLPDQLQSLTAEQKLQYFYMLNQGKQSYSQHPYRP